jgi:hypothetical protein
VDEPTVAIQCKECGAHLDEDPGATPKSPCPHCGSTSRHMSMTMGATVEMRSSMDAKMRREGSKRFAAHHRSGASFFRKLGRWHILTRVIDREQDRYYEKVVDEETGEVLREVDERLSDHQGHGDGRKGRQAKG